MQMAAASSVKLGPPAVPVSPGAVYGAALNASSLGAFSLRGGIPEFPGRFASPAAKAMGHPVNVVRTDRRTTVWGVVG